MSAGPSPMGPAPGALPADIGLVAATRLEVAPLVAKLRDVRKYRGPKLTIVEGECSGKLVAVAITKMGRAHAQRGAELLLAGHRPRWIVSAGFAGALDPSLRRNDIVLPNEIVNREGRKFAIDVAIPPESEAQGLRTGRLLTVDEFVRTAAEKAELRREFQADVVDMETSAVAAFCGERGERFLSVRVVSDEAGVDLPPEVMAIVGESGGLRLGAAFGVLWKRPSSVADLLTLRKHALEAADRLSTFLEATFARLP